MACKILIVDDNPFVARLWSRKLREAGYLVQTAVDGMSARMAVCEWRPDLVLLDVVLPDTDGLTLCREWRSESLSAHLRVVFVSALTSRRDMDAAYDAGADGYMTKSPETASALLAKIGQILNPVANEPPGNRSLLVARGGVSHGA
jgi:DNA-binding response OmpR family regulator